MPEDEAVVAVDLQGERGAIWYVVGSRHVAQPGRVPLRKDIRSPLVQFTKVGVLQSD